MPLVQVIATQQGYDGTKVREPGDVFQIDDKVFAPRPKLDEKGKPTGDFYPKPSWFERAVAKPVPQKFVPASEVEQHRQARVEAREAFGPEETGSDLT